VKNIIRVVIPTIFIAVVSALLLHYSSHAATLANVYLYMNRIQTNIATGIEYVLAINTTTTIPTGGTITIEFPDAGDTTWCRTAGSLTATGVSSSEVDLASTGWAIDAALPGTLSATCSQGSTGTSDTITITGLTALTGGTTYGVKIAGNLGVLGTNSAAGVHDVIVTAFQGTTADSMTFKIQLLTSDQVVVSAIVSSAPSVGCSITGNAVNLGTLYPGGNYATATNSISTTATSGYYWAVYGTGNGTSGDAGLWKSSATTYLIPSGPNDTIDLTVAGSEGFGITVSQPTGAVVPASFSDSTLGTFGTIDRTSSAAKLILSQNGAQASAESATITYGARAGASAVAGSYQETITFICGGYY
jgi:hypothetical protein